MNIGIRPHDTEFKNIDELILNCQTLGVSGLQLVLVKNFPEAFKNDNLDEIFSKLQANNINIYLLGSYFNMIHPNDETLNTGIDIFLKNTKIAKKYSLTTIGSETGSVNGDAWTYNPKNHTDESYLKFEQTLNQIITNDVNVCIEPVYDHTVYDIDRVQQVLNTYKDLNLIVDLANLLNELNAQNYQEIFTYILENYKNKIKVFHFKNLQFINGEKKLVQLDEGIIDYEFILQKINEHSLQHIPVIVEEISGDMLKNSINYLKKLEEK